MTSTYASANTKVLSIFNTQFTLISPYLFIMYLIGYKKFYIKNEYHSPLKICVIAAASFNFLLDAMFLKIRLDYYVNQNYPQDCI